MNRCKRAICVAQTVDGVTHLMSAVQAFRLARGSYPDSDADTERPLLALSQQNGHLCVFEYIDLSTTKINKAKERAGWMAYMFDDIKGLSPTAETFSLVRPEKDSGVEQTDYAKTILRGARK